MSESKSSDISKIRRVEATSERVSYADSVVLHESSRTRIVLVPFFIQRSQQAELAVKIITYKKQPPPLDWIIINDKSISLNEAASRNLLDALKKHLAISAHSDSGDYIAIRVSNGKIDIGDSNPSLVAEAVLGVLSQKEIVNHISNKEFNSELINAFRGAIRFQELKSAISNLRNLLDSGAVDEPKYQDWCEKHNWAFGNAYVMRDAVRNISISDQIDLLLSSVISGYRDIVELKRPDKEVINYDSTHKNYYFNAEVSKAIGQCHRYLDILQEYARNGLQDHPEIVAYHPRAIVVIGRSNGWNCEMQRALHGLNSRLNGITIMTYDHLLSQGERLISILNTQIEENTQEEDPSYVFFEEEDTPF